MKSSKTVFKRSSQNSSDRESYKSKLIISVPVVWNTSKLWASQNVPGQRKNKTGCPSPLILLSSPAKTQVSDKGRAGPALVLGLKGAGLIP